MNAHRDLGPSMPSRAQVHETAQELFALVRIALDTSAADRNTDLPRALAQFDKMRRILGGDSA